MDTMLKQPIVTIILPVYNGGSYLSAAIRSVLNQTYTTFELLIIDDGSTDTSVETVREFTDQRILLIQHTSNKKLIATLNEGLTLARGKYIARIDSDDMWSDINKLEKQISFLENHAEYALIGTNGIAIDAHDKKLFTLRYPCTDQNIRQQILIKNCFIHSSVVFRKETALTAGGFLSEEKHAEDYGLWLRMGTIAKFANLPDPAVHYRIIATGITQQNNQVQIKTCLQLIKKHKTTYPHYILGVLKWKIKQCICMIFSAKQISTLKNNLID